MICCFVEEFEAITLRIAGNGAAEIQVDFSEEHKVPGTEAQRAFLKRYFAPRKHSGKKGSIARSFFRSANLTSFVFMLQNSRVEHRKKPCNKNDATAEKHGILAKIVQKLKDTDKALSCHLQKFGSLPAPSSKKPEER